ncbi:MAG: VCBS repeat-containing protein [Candidatus Hinthialibacter antarcticus]|nr:VCBS repeat-containing protein [Candidatus Hinthialibacter antarcticus]
MKIHIFALAFVLSIQATAFSQAEIPLEQNRMAYNHPGLVVDLGVGLWAVPFPIDWDNDGDNDLLASTADVPYKGIYLFENNGSDVFLPGKRLGSAKHNLTISYINNKEVICEPGKMHDDFRNNLFSNPKPIPFEKEFYSGRANQWKFADYDGDKITDLLIGTSDWRDYGWDNAYDAKGNWTHGAIHGHVYWVKNNGTNDAPKYGAATQIQIGDKPLEVYGCPSPNLVDWDNDGDMDLICGEFLDGIRFFENTGTRQTPVYSAGQRLKANGKEIKMELQMLQVVVFDWDQDSDMDIVVGQEDGRVAWIENAGKDNTGAPQLRPPVFFQQQAENVKCGALATPCSIDWDGDGDEDLICGNSAGFIEWIENLGGDPHPKWAEPKRLSVNGEEIRILAGENLSIQGPAEAKWGYSVPYAADWDMDGLPDIVMNTIVGKMIWYRNIGTRSNPALAAARPIEVEWQNAPPKPAWNWWNPNEKELVVQWRTRPNVLDLNDDGLNDLILIDHEGYLSFFERSRQENQLITLPGKRIFLDENGDALNLNNGIAGKSGRRKINLVDWDGDNDFDILINSPRSSPEKTRNISYYENTSEKAHTFAFRYRGDITPNRLEGHTTSPTNVDWNGDGIQDLLVGGEDGHFYFYPRKSNDEMLGDATGQ